MGLRPIRTRWLEVLCPADDVTRAAEALARTGRVQVESTAQTPGGVRELRERLPEVEQLARAYGRYWPTVDARIPGASGSPARVLEEGITALRAWTREADPVIERIEALEKEQEQLTLVAELLDSAQGELPDLAELAGEHRFLDAQLLVLPPRGKPPELPPDTLAQWVEGPAHTLVLAVAPAAARGALERAAEAARARCFRLPAWIPSSRGEAREAVERRQREIEEQLEAAWERLERVHDAHGIRRALRDLRRLQWYVERVPAPEHTRHFALVSGWTDASSREELERALEEADVRSLVRFAEPPRDRTAPMVLRNPRWARPFEVFASLVGVPSHGEVDPSILLTVIVPLLFGYMFGDIGQGAVLVVAGLLLRKRVPALSLLVPGGVSAIFFGFLFGSLFAVEHVVPALWIHPMEHPLILLGAAVAGGAVILVLGLLLGGLGAAFQGRFVHWLLTDAAVVAMYVGVLSLVLDPAGGIVALVGLGWFVVGSAIVAEQRPVRTALGELGELVERLLQLGVNTVSFARVGAFALAHAGLSAAIMGMAEGAGPVTTAVVLVLGNAVILVIEGLVVSIQTTRLVLFEFFVRFLKAEGRAFTPLAPPPERELRAGGGRPAATRSGS